MHEAFRGGARAVAARRRARESTRVARVGRAVSRPSTACAAARASMARSDIVGRRSRRGGVRPRGRRRERRGRPAAAHLHLLPSGAGPDAQVAITLREVCGLSTEEIARAFVVPPRRRSRSGSFARRARSGRRRSRTRCRRRPSCRSDSMPCSASSTSSSTRDMRPRAATRSRAPTCRPRRSGWRGCWWSSCPSPRPSGCSRSCCCRNRARAARTSQSGDIILLDEQDRSLWNRAAIEEGTRARAAARSRRGGSAPIRCRRRSPPCTPRPPTAAATDWDRIVGTYDLLSRSSRRRSSS